MHYNPLITFIVAISLLGTTAASSYALARKNLVNDLVTRGVLDQRLAAGIGFSVSDIDSAPDMEIETASFLYEKAKKASEEGEWLRVKALLEESAATERIDYSQYASALLLLGEATEKVAGIEARIAGELALLREEAVREASARKTAEDTQKKTATQLADTQKSKEAQATALLQKLSTSEEEKRVAEQRAIDEEHSSFINELDVYVSLLLRGDTALRSSEVEIDAGRDAQMLVYLNQAEDLFLQIEAKGIDLRDNRTPEIFVGAAGDLLRAVGIYRSSARSYRNMVALFSEGGDAYDAKRKDAISARKDGFAVVEALRTTIANAR
ncbi:MAG: hypothetical protein Q8P93_02255 [bacterium]|nr:hypothetical protein [bacterium]